MAVLEYLRFPHASFSYIALFFFFIIFIYLFYLVKTFYDKKRYKRLFLKEATEKGLLPEEVEILWIYAIKEGKDPFLTLEFKVVFEKAIDIYLKNDTNPSEKLVKNMREKLGFDEVPYFVPIVSTKDIELFQPAKISFSDGYSAEAVLFDKDEYHMYWAFTDPIPLNRIEKGGMVTVTFVRKGDAVYKLTLPVEDIYEEREKLFVKLPHTFKFERFQRRNYPRVEVDIACKIGFSTDEGIRWTDVRLKDLSIGGVKVSLSPEDAKYYLSLLAEIRLEFFLEGKHFNLKGRVVSEDIRKKVVYVGIEFIDIKDSQQQVINNFVKKKQKQLVELYVRSKE